MKNNIIFTLLLSILLGIGYTQAQNNGAKKKGEHKEHHDTQKLTPEQKAQKNSERLEKKLTLTADQKTKIYDYALVRIKKAGEVKTSEEKDKKVKGDALKAIRDEYVNNVNSVLTPEQKIKWEQLKAEAKARRQEHKKEGGKKGTSSNENDEDTDLDD